MCQSTEATLCSENDCLECEPGYSLRNIDPDTNKGICVRGIQLQLKQQRHASDEHDHASQSHAPDTITTGTTTTTTTGPGSSGGGAARDNGDGGGNSGVQWPLHRDDDRGRDGAGADDSTGDEVRGGEEQWDWVAVVCEGVFLVPHALFLSTLYGVRMSLTVLSWFWGIHI